MNVSAPEIWLLLFAAVSIAAVAIRFWAHRSGMAARETEMVRLREENVRLQTQLEAERKRGEERLQDLEKAREALVHQFKALSQEILEDKSQRFTELNKSNIDAILKPLNERIGEFRKQVADVYDRESKDRAGLKAEIGQLKSLHQQMSEDARRLTSALKGDSKAQGGWGEVILKRVFEASGLAEGREYELQVNLSGDGGGRLRPDAVVHLPEGRDMVVDAKVSLTAYERLCAAETEDERQNGMAEHLQSVRAHVERLSAKDYHALDGIAAPDFVLMFVPVEGAYIEAVRADSGLHDFALRKNVVVLSPSNMLPTLRVVEHMWRADKQNRNAQTIAEEAGKLYDKFVNFVKDVEEVGERIRQAQNAYDKAENKLAAGRGNLVRRVERLRELGAAANKRLADGTRTGSKALAGHGDDDTSDDATEEE